MIFLLSFHILIYSLPSFHIIVPCSLSIPSFHSSSQSRSLPPKLLELVQSLFPNFFDTYEITCQSHLHRDGQAMIDPFGEKRGHFQYGAILSRLNKIRENIEAKFVDDEEGVGSGSGSGQPCDMTPSDSLKSAGLT